MSADILADCAASSIGVGIEIDRYLLLSEARRLRDQFGWSIIAVGPDKRPLGAWKKFQKLRPTDSELTRMFSLRCATGLAVMAGHVSGDLVCRDFDDESGRVNFEAWAAQRPDLAATLPTVRTPRGYHVYFNCPGLSKTRKQGDGELRGSGYSLLPPSLNKNGKQYCWLIEPKTKIPTIDDVLSVGLARHLGADKPDITHSWVGCNESDTEVVPYMSGLKDTCTSERGRDGGEEVAASSLSPEEEVIVTSTLPTGVRQRNDLLWDLALYLKARNRDDRPESVRHVVEEWHARALPVIGTKPFSWTWSEFCRAWGRVTGPPISWPAIITLATTIPTPRIAIELGYSPRRQKLVRVLVAAQRLWGDLPFFLSAWQAEKACGLKHTAAHEALKAFEKDGIIVCVKKGEGFVGGRASWWRCLVEAYRQWPPRRSDSLSPIQKR